MSLLLTLVKAPRPQPVRQMRLEEGELVIGRSAEADWRIDDPDQYVSRAHCTVAGRGGVFTVTDTSSGGLFVDEARTPLGPGRSVPLSDGMRLRLGDYVRARSSCRGRRRRRRVPAARAGAGAGPSFDADGFFSTPGRRAAAPRAPARPARPVRADRRASAAVDTPRRSAAARPPSTTPSPSTRRLPTASRERPAPPAFDWDTPAPPAPAAPPAPPAAGGSGFEPGTEPEPPAPPPRPAAAAAAAPRARRPARGRRRTALAAFLRGLGLDPADAPGRRRWRAWRPSGASTG